MEYETQRLRVIARIPKISRSGSGSDIHLVAHEEDGRLISQTVAFRLLAATALLLLFVAIIPYSIGIGGKTPASAPTLVERDAHADGDGRCSAWDAGCRRRGAEDRRNTADVDLATAGSFE